MNDRVVLTARSDRVVRLQPFFFLLMVLLMAWPDPLLGQQIPTSHRSRQAAQRVTPQLHQQLATTPYRLGSPAFIRIFKEERVLEVWLQDKQGDFGLFKVYPVCTYGFRGLGPKQRQGDGRAPEGFYFVGPASLNPYSSYHLSFNLGYPNRYDRAHQRTGGALMVHGRCVSIGCYAMTDPFIEEIYTLVSAALQQGQPFFRVHIFPFKMTEANMARHKRSKWYPFWQNLQEGYDYFEQNNHRPPNVEVVGQRYAFSPAQLGKKSGQ